MNSFFHATISWLSAVVASFKNSLIFTQDMTDASVNTCCKLKPVFLENRLFSFPADSILKSDGDFISNWKFPDCVHFFGAWNRQAVIETIAVVYDSRKELRRNYSPIGHNNTRHFLCPIRSRHSLKVLEIARWESVPRGSFASTWKLSSPLFYRPNWLPLGLQGCVTYKIQLQQTLNIYSNILKKKQ